MAIHIKTPRKDKQQIGFRHWKTLSSEDGISISESEDRLLKKYSSDSTFSSEVYIRVAVVEETELN